MVKLGVGPGRIIRRLVIVGGNVQRLLVQVYRYGVGTATGRILGSQVIQPQCLEPVQNGLRSMIEWVGALKRHVQVPGCQYPMFSRGVIVSDEGP